MINYRKITVELRCYSYWPNFGGQGFLGISIWYSTRAIIQKRKKRKKKKEKLAREVYDYTLIPNKIWKVWQSMQQMKNQVPCWLKRFLNAQSDMRQKHSTHAVTQANHMYTKLMLVWSRDKVVGKADCPRWGQSPTTSTWAHRFPPGCRQAVPTHPITQTTIHRTRADFTRRLLCRLTKGHCVEKYDELQYCIRQPFPAGSMSVWQAFFKCLAVYMVWELSRIWVTFIEVIIRRPAQH